MSTADLARLPPAPEVVQLEVGLLQNLCTLLFCPKTRQGALVDPAWEPDRLLALVDAHGVVLTTILVTHTHHDHIEALPALAARLPLAVAVHPNEAGRVDAVLTGIEPQPACIALADRMDIAIGACGVRALETFGHTSGGVSFLADGFVVTGDVLFVGGCGRTDFPGGDTRALWQSLQRLCALPEETRVFPGHDYGTTPTSTIGRELLENPYLRCPDFEAFRVLRERRRA